MAPQHEPAGVGAAPAPVLADSPQETTRQHKPVALVTGANQGIGLQIARELVTHGFTVLVGSRNLERGEAAAQEIGADAIALQLDVTDGASIAAAAERIRRELGRLDVLIQNAAISNTRKGDMSLQEYAQAPARNGQRLPCTRSCSSHEAPRAAATSCKTTAPTAGGRCPAASLYKKMIARQARCREQVQGQLVSHNPARYAKFPRKIFSACRLAVSSSPISGLVRTQRALMAGGRPCSDKSSSRTT